MSSVALPAISQESGLGGYLKAIQSFPLISQEEETDCARRWRENGDRDAAHRLVTSHLRLVVKIARRYRSYPVPLPDLISEGNVGLMKAVRNFDPDKGCRLATYAMWWIKAEITDFILATWSLVRVSSTHKRLYSRLQRIKARLRIADANDLEAEHVADLANEVGLSTDRVVSLAHQFEQRDVSLNAPVGDAEEGEEHIARLVDEDPDPETRFAEADIQAYRRDIIRKAMADLREREQQVVTDRWLREDPLTLQEIGDRYGITRERVRQIEKAALRKIRIRICEQHGEDAARAAVR